MESLLRQHLLATRLFEDLAFIGRPSLVETVSTIVNEGLCKASQKAAGVHESEGAPTMPQPFPDVSDAAKMLISSCPSGEIIGMVSAQHARSLACLKPAFEPQDRYLVGAELSIDQDTIAEGTQWRSLYRPNAPSVAILEPYGLAGVEFAALAAARSGQNNPSAPNIIIVPALPDLVSYDGLGHLVVRGGLLVDHNGSIHSGIFPTPIACSTVVPGSQVIEFAAELRTHGVGVIGSPEALQKGFSKFHLKKLLAKVGVKAPRAICISESEPSHVRALVKDFIAHHPRHRGIVVKPDRDAQGTGVVIFGRNVSLARLVQAAQRTVELFGRAVVEERIPSFSLCSAGAIDSNFRILRAPGGNSWIGIEIRASDSNRVVNLHTGASAYRFNADAIAQITGLQRERAEALFTRLHRLLDETSKRVADVMGGDVVAIDVIVDNHFIPYVNEAATSMGGGLRTLAGLDGSLEERLNSGEALFHSIARRVRRDKVSTISTLPIEQELSRVASSSVKLATFCGLNLLTDEATTSSGLIACALHRCLLQRDPSISTVNLDTYYHHIINALTDEGLHSHIAQMVHELGPLIESMPLTLCSLALYAKRIGEATRAEHLIEYLQEKWQPEAKVGHMIGTTALRLGARDSGYLGAALRAEAVHDRTENLRQIKTLLGLTPRLDPRTRLTELLKHNNDPHDLLLEADFWRKNCQYDLSFKLVAYAVVVILSQRPRLTHQAQLLGKVCTQLADLEPYFPGSPSLQSRGSAIKENVNIQASKGVPLAWVCRRIGARVRSFFEKRILGSIVRRAWNPDQEGASLTRVMSFVRQLRDFK